MYHGFFVKISEHKLYCSLVGVKRKHLCINVSFSFCLNAIISRTNVSKVLMNRNVLCAEKLSPCLHHDFLRSVVNVMLPNIVNTVHGTSVVCDVWQMKYHIGYIADGKAHICSDTTYNMLRVYLTTHISCLKGAVIGSPISTIVGNLFMEEFKTKAIGIGTNTWIHCYPKDRIQGPISGTHQLY